MFFEFQKMELHEITRNELGTKINEKECSIGVSL